MRPSSSTSRGIVDPLFGSAEVDAEMDDRAWLAAMLEVEGALALSEADAGVVPADHARAIADACRVEYFDVDDIGQRALRYGNPAAAVAAALKDALVPQAAEHVHHGATSQDVVDTSLSLMAHRATAVVVEDLRGASAACAQLAGEHRGTVMLARTLLQPALPTTFGLKAAGWMVALDEATIALQEVRSRSLAVQLGGAAGTLASLGNDGLHVLRNLATRLRLEEPVVPWHTNRSRFVALAAALGLAGGVLHKIALDVILLAQEEVGEVRERDDGGGLSSTLPQKRNPLQSVLVVGAAERMPAMVATMFDAMAQEHERAAGAWHAEWETLRTLIRLTGGAASRTRRLLAGLEIDAVRMRRNLESTNGQVMAESVAAQLRARVGSAAAAEALRGPLRSAAQDGVHLRDVLVHDDRVRTAMSEEEIDSALDPERYLGVAGELVQRALAHHRTTGSEP